MAVAYSGVGIQNQKQVVDRVVLAHFDSHGTLFAAARAAVLSARGEEVAVIAKFPETGPQGLSDASILKLVEDLQARKAVEIIDIPINVRAPDASIKTLKELGEKLGAPVYYYDHHETDVPFIPRLLEQGSVFPMVFQSNVAMATALELVASEQTRLVAAVGMVADRDRDVLKLYPRDVVERQLLPLANKMDVIVRNPRVVGAETPGDVAARIAEEGLRVVEQAQVSYPPYEIARELQEKGAVEKGEIAILVDWRDMPFQHSAWTPKTLEQLMLMNGREVAVAVTPGYNPRTKQVEGWDVRVLRYWLSERAPIPEEVVKDLIAVKAIEGQVVGHADYVSIRFGSPEEAMDAARKVFRRYEGELASAAHLVNDVYVAEAVRRDYAKIMETLRRLEARIVDIERVLGIRRARPTAQQQAQ